MVVGLPFDIANFFIAQDMADANREEYERLMQTLGTSLKPEDYDKSLYTPQMTSMPDDLMGQQISEDPALKQRQMANLDSLKAVSEGKINAQRDLDLYRAIQDANAMARARDEGALQSAQARGVGGGGLEFTMRQQAGQDAANRLQQAQMASAAQAALERLQATGQLQSGLSNMRDQDYRTNAQNTDIINKFNVMNSTRRQEALDKRAMLANEAAQYNKNRSDRNIATNNALKSSNYFRGADLGNQQRNQQMQLDYAPIFRLNDQFKTTTQDLVGGAMGGDMGGGMGGGSGAWSNIGSMIGSQAGSQMLNNNLDKDTMLKTKLY